MLALGGGQELLSCSVTYDSLCYPGSHRFKLAMDIMNSLCRHGYLFNGWRKNPWRFFDGFRMAEPQLNPPGCGKSKLSIE